MWAARPHRRRSRPTAPGQSLAVSPDGTLLAVGTAAGLEVFRLGPRPTRVFSVADPDGVNDIAWSGDGSRVETASGSGAVRIFDRDGRLLSVLIGHLGSALGVGWDGPTRAVSVGTDGAVRQWDATAGVEQRAAGAHTGIRRRRHLRRARLRGRDRRGRLLRRALDARQVGDHAGAARHPGSQHVLGRSRGRTRRQRTPGRALGRRHRARCLGPRARREAVPERHGRGRGAGSARSAGRPSRSPRADRS